MIFVGGYLLQQATNIIFHEKIKKYISFKNVLFFKVIKKLLTVLPSLGSTSSGSKTATLELLSGSNTMSSLDSKNQRTMPNSSYVNFGKSNNKY